MIASAADVAADISGWCDAHVAFSGYRNDPLEGAAFSPFTATYDQLANHGVAGARQLGTAAEFAAFDANFADRDRTMTISRSGPYIEPTPQGFRLTRSVADLEQLRQAIDIHRAENFHWLMLGSGLDLDLVRAATDLRGDTQRIAIEGSPSRIAVAAQVDTVEGLHALLVDVSPGAEAGEVWRSVARLADTPVAQHLDTLGPLIESDTVLVPLVVAVRRACLLSEIVSAPGIAELTTILPFHSRIAELRNPGAYRFGRKHAERYLGLPRLNREETAEFEAGWSRLCEVLAGFIERGGHVAGGSGAPSTGLAPGYALAEEARSWAQAGVPVDTVRHAFTEMSGALIHSPSQLDGSPPVQSVVRGADR